MIKAISCFLLRHNYKRTILSLEGDWQLKCQRCGKSFWVAGNLTDEQKREQWEKQEWS